MKATERLAPLGALLDARYFPLLFAAAPQAYTVYKWLYGGDKSSEGWLFAVVGALGFEMVYIGAIAWAEGKTKSYWFWITAFAALVFSILVALRVYLPNEAEWAFLHSGFPLVAFCYTMLMHRANAHSPETISEIAQIKETLAAITSEISQPKSEIQFPDYSQTFAEIGNNLSKLAETVTTISRNQGIQFQEMQRLNSEIISLKRETETRKPLQLFPADSGAASFPILPETAKEAAKRMKANGEEIPAIAKAVGKSVRQVRNYLSEE